MISRHLAGRSDKAMIAALTHDPFAYPMALGCGVCRDKGPCGGLCVKAPIFDCLDYCCGSPDSCSRVCRNEPERFVNQMREIGGFEFDDVPRAPAIAHQLESDIVPLIYHGGSRVRAMQGEVFALRLPDLMDFKKGRLRYTDRELLCAAYRIPTEAKLVLTGVNLDHRIEPWWRLGERRLAAIDEMRLLGIELATTPNFSVVLDQPRTDDLHAIKRISIIFAEFTNGGIACALHPNGRTERDFERWGDLVAGRTEIVTLAYEFITGPARTGRQAWHLARLADLARIAGRPLDIVVRGDPSVIGFLRQHFRKVIYIETTAFMKTLKRRRAERAGNERLRWPPDPNAPELVDDLLMHNLHERELLLRALHYSETAGEVPH